MFTFSLNSAYLDIKSKLEILLSGANDAAKRILRCSL